MSGLIASSSLVAAASCVLTGDISFYGGAVYHCQMRYDRKWAVEMIFIVIIRGVGTLESPIGTTIYYGICDQLTNVFPLSGNSYLVALGAVAVLAMLIAVALYLAIHPRSPQHQMPRRFAQMTRCRGASQVRRRFDRSHNKSE